MAAAGGGARRRVVIIVAATHERKAAEPSAAMPVVPRKRRRFDRYFQYRSQYSAKLNPLYVCWMCPGQGTAPYRTDEPCYTDSPDTFGRGRVAPVSARAAAAALAAGELAGVVAGVALERCGPSRPSDRNRPRSREERRSRAVRGSGGRASTVCPAGVSASAGPPSSLIGRSCVSYSPPHATRGGRRVRR